MIVLNVVAALRNVMALTAVTAKIEVTALRRDVTLIAPLVVVALRSAMALNAVTAATEVTASRRDVILTASIVVAASRNATALNVVISLTGATAMTVLGMAVMNLQRPAMMSWSWGQVLQGFCARHTL